MSGTNPVATWSDPNSTSDSSTSVVAKWDGGLIVAKRVADSFAPHPASPAIAPGTANNLIIDAGFIEQYLPSGLSILAEVAQQSVTIGAAPSSPNNRIDLVAIDMRTGAASVIAGTVATSPTAPAITAGLRQIALVSIPNGTSTIGATNITDVRSVWGARQFTPFCVASGPADALTGAFTPTTPTLNASKFDGYIWRVRAVAANATTTPTFAPDGQGPWTITKNNNLALAGGDIAGAGHELLLAFNWNGGSPFIELLNPAASPFTTGDVKATLKTAADTGWVMMNDGTIGDASSGASTRANADTSALFQLLWNGTSNANCAVSSGRGGSAAADFAAHKTIALPKLLGRALASAGAGSGLTSRALAATVGAETHTLTGGEIPSVAVSTTVSATGTADLGFGPSAGAGADSSLGGQGLFGTDAVSDFTAAVSVTGTGTGATAGGGGAHDNMQPTSFLNFMVKL